VISNASQLDPELFARLQGLELRARYVVDGYLAGMHRGAVRGQSVEFAEHREYVAGDDLRYVDWKVFGKTDKVYLKQFEAETDLVCHLLVDVSESMQYQSDSAMFSKLEYAQCLAAALGHLVLRQRDRVSLATFDDQIRELVPESGNPTHLSQLVDVLQKADVCHRSDLGKVLHEVSRRVRRRGVVVVLSDLLGDTDSLLSGLKHLRYARHEVIVLQLLDPAELDFPFRRATRFEGLESLPAVLANPRGIREAYLTELASFLDRVKIGCRALQVDYQLARTAQPLDTTLRRLLINRNVRRA